MDRLEITGGQRLQGDIVISGAKNAALPLMATSLMAGQPLHLSHMPELADIDSMADLLRHLGVAVSRQDDAMTLEASADITTEAPYDLVRKMRASVLVLGPLLARYGRARVSLPGGCAIGTRPVDLHIRALQQLGAELDLVDGNIIARATSGNQGRLSGARIRFPQISVGATENTLMAAVLARGESELLNCAREPEITDLAKCLIAMGARIEGHGSSIIRVQGVESLGGAQHPVVADRIEAGTYAIAAAITGGSIRLVGADAGHLAALFEKLQHSVARVETDAEGITISADSRVLPVDISTAPFPDFPTDLQAQFMALMCLADGTARISETIFENRFMHVPELLRMGADIRVSGGEAHITGVSQLHAAPVMATDLRASVSLVLAALAARGTTTIQRVYHLDRGYEQLEAKLNACGASIRRLSDGSDKQATPGED